MPLIYICSPLSAPTRAEMLANMKNAAACSILAAREFQGRAVAPHAYLPYLLDDSVPEERALALEFGQKLLALCSSMVVCGTRISEGMRAEIETAGRLGIPVFYRPDMPGVCEQGGDTDAM